jgi:hypothetical protein
MFGHPNQVPRSTISDLLKPISRIETPNDKAKNRVYFSSKIVDAFKRE